MEVTRAVRAVAGVISIVKSAIRLVRVVGLIREVLTIEVRSLREEVMVSGTDVAMGGQQRQGNHVVGAMTHDDQVVARDDSQCRRPVWSQDIVVKPLLVKRTNGRTIGQSSPSARSAIGR